MKPRGSTLDHGTSLRNFKLVGRNADPINVRWQPDPPATNICSRVSVPIDFPSWPACALPSKFCVCVPLSGIEWCETKPTAISSILRSTRMDRLAAMEAFVLVVDTGSFSAAARRLNVGQPAVSKLIAQLEVRLGVKLLVRTTRGLTATEAGLNYYERARRSILEADEAEQAARGAGSGLTGKLRIAAAVTFARIHLMSRLPEFLQRHPDLEIEVVLDDRNVDLVQEGIDVALRMGRQLANSSLTVRRIASAPCVVVGTPAYFARAGEPTAPGDLAAHQAV